MPSAGGALSGALSGAKLGSMFGPWGTGIGAAAGGLLGLFTGGKSKLQKGMENKILPNMDNLMHWSGQDRDARNTFVGMSTPAFQDSLDFYQGSLDPNSSSALDSLLGPSRTALSDQHQNVIQNLAQGPRGGGANALTAQAGFNLNRQLMELVPQARSMAADKMSQLAQVLGQLGLNFGQLSAQEAEGVLAAITSLLTGQQNEHYRSQQGAGALGQQLGTLLGPIIGKIFNKGGSGGGAITGAGDTWPGEWGMDSWS